jgi:sugar phosphate isomerase/epimerase
LSDLVKPHAGKSVGAALDSARVLAAGHSPTHAAVELAGLIHVWVCADAVRSGSSVQNVPLGNGGGDIRAVAERLDEQYFSGPVIVDIRGLANPVAAARHAAGVLQDMLPSGSSSLQR